MTQKNSAPARTILAPPAAASIDKPRAGAIFGGTALMAAGAGIGLFYAARAAVRRSRQYDFRGKNVLITGGSRGLGLVLARRFNLEGASLAICARDEAELARAREGLEGHGHRLLTLRCDVTKRDEVEQMVRTVIAQLGGIDVLVNNAGTITVGPMEVMTQDDYEVAMRTHFWAPLYATLAVLPAMRRRRAGRIVNVSSIAGKVAVPHLLPYTASKFALTGLSNGLRQELLKDGVYVTTVCPGLMRTGSPRNALFKGQHRAEYAWFSISDSLPVASMDADRAARQIVDACRYGRAEVILSIQAKLAVTFYNLFPNLATDLQALIAHVLPGPGEHGGQAVPGHDSSSAWSPSWMTSLGDRAARENNEMG